MAPSDYEITEAMLVLGGGFVQKLAFAFRAADENNQRRLKLAFPDYWEEYREHAVRNLQRMSERMSER